MGVLDEGMSISIEMIMFFGTFLLIIILFAESYEWSSNLRTCQKGQMSYSYDDDNGPATWKDTFEDARGCKQSPINLKAKFSLMVKGPPLAWSAQYMAIPSCGTITNDGHSVVLTFQWPGAKPTVSGGCLQQPYELCCLKIRWGSLDHEGSEHTLDYKRFAMELQAVHEARRTPEETQRPADTLIISYLYQISDHDNPYLEVLVSCLSQVRCAHEVCVLPRFPIGWLVQVFATDYFTYLGSLTYPPCTESVTWIIQPEPIAVSSKQVRQFRKLYSETGPLETNCRPLQKTNSRKVFYYTSQDPCS